jgi:tetratricopeptide (TPR) repeat protein
MRLGGHLFELACVLQDAGRVDEAEPLLRRAIVLAQTSDPPDWEQEIAWSGLLARVLQVKGEMGAAEELYRSALAVAEDHHGPEHAGIVLPLNNLAVLLFDTGRYGEARETAARAYAVAKETLGESDPQTQVCGRTLQGISDALSAAAAAEKERLESIARPRIPIQQ